MVPRKNHLRREEGFTMKRHSHNLSFLKLRWIRGGAFSYSIIHVIISFEEYKEGWVTIETLESPLMQSL